MGEENNELKNKFTNLDTSFSNLKRNLEEVKAKNYELGNSEKLITKIIKDELKVEFTNCKVEMIEELTGEIKDGLEEVVDDINDLKVGKD